MSRWLFPVKAGWVVSKSFSGTSDSSLAVRKEMLTIRHRLLLQEISAQASLLLLIPVDLNIETDEWFTVDEAYARSEHGRIIPNATQHNVPAWSMFAVFFIVVSLAGNMIRERETGCLNRLMTMPCSYAVYLFHELRLLFPRRGIPLRPRGRVQRNEVHMGFRPQGLVQFFTQQIGLPSLIINVTDEGVFNGDPLARPVRVIGGGV